MSLATDTSTSLSHEKYFMLEEQLQQKHEYIGGEVFAMTGGSVKHGLIGKNATTALDIALKNTPCTAYNSDVKLHIAAADGYFHPDAMVLCDEGIVHDHFVESPVLIIEVLSESTEGYDHGKKFAFYRQIDALQTYIMLHQDTPLTEVYRRRSDNSWLLKEYAGLDSVIKINDDLSLSMRDLYNKIDF